MRKIGLLLLAMIFALGTLGVGYAMWSDTITVDGTVNTGTVEIEVIDYSGTAVFKNLADSGMEVEYFEGMTDYDDWRTTTEAYESDGYELVASAYAYPGTSTIYDVGFSYYNLFPIGDCGPYCADFTAKYTGTIPVHVVWDWGLIEDNEIVGPGEISDPAIKDLMYYYASISYDINNGEQTGSFAPLDEGTVIQLHENDEINFNICIDIPQEWPEGDNTKDDLSGKTFEFVGKLIAFQWNEDAPAVDLSDLVPNNLN
jgi:hypothetical protein